MNTPVSQRSAQRNASDPRVSAWVDASAGTGKTKVLTDRVLRLLLSGAEPERILCLTFTRAAAAEMANRILERLGDWASTSDGDLDAALEDLTGNRPGDIVRSRARQLFAHIVDAQPGLRIQTIHAFCQSVLRRFPFEANIPPHFDLIDDRTRDEMLGESQRDLLTEAGRHADAPLGHAMAVLVEHMTEFGFAELMQAVVGQRTEMTRALDAAGGPGLLIQTMWRHLGLEPGTSAADILTEACRDDAIDCAGLRHAAENLAGGSATDRKRAEGISAWLDATDRATGWESYVRHFLTAQREPNRAYAKTNAHKAMAHILDVEAERLVAVADRLNAAATARATDALLTIASGLLARYAKAKDDRAVLDYDDLTERTLHLLRDTGAAWVLYKLDGGIGHILVDEAQDTNPDQWRIVQVLAEELFAGEGARDQDRTIFAVGDEKQSIFSFQGADPATMGRMRAHFADKIAAAEKSFVEVDLTKSFRSTQPVLSLVDSVFAQGAARDGVLSDPAAVLRHEIARIGHGGVVELWPSLGPAEEREASEPWALPLEPGKVDEPMVQLANQVADRIASWIESGEVLASHGRPIVAGDIMILVRRRTRFVGPVVRALKQRGVAVAGVDRLALTQPLAVQDLMALGRFLLLPEDSLTLAALLKTPLIGLDEDQLFALAYGRKGGLWTALIAKAEDDPAFEPARRWLADLLAKVDYLRPYELFAQVLALPCPGDPEAGGSGRRGLWQRLGPDALDPLDEFLSAALEYERQHAPTLEGFIGWLEVSEAEVKRELATRGDSVKIVTVHGAKGLEAPVVIMPDTMQVPRPHTGPTLLWHRDDRGRPIPYWVPRRDVRPRLCSTLATDIRTKTDQEYRRLLYVALTRARDRLYIHGWHGRQRPAEGHWHGLIEAGMQAAGAIEIDHGGIGVLRIEQPQTAALPARPAADEQNAAQPRPDWTRQAPSPEPRPSRPLAPSRLEAQGDGQGPAAHSPSSPEDNERFRRGRAIHRLLQLLPGVPPPGRPNAASRILSSFAPDVVQSLAKAALSVLDDPACAEFFGPNSRAEVPVVGQVGTRGIAGRIDRLLVGATHIAIVDFKTGRPPANDLIPASYLGQMAAYRAVLRQIYPDRTIVAVIIWTEGPRVMVIDPGALDPIESYLTATPAA